MAFARWQAFIGCAIAVAGTFRLFDIFIFSADAVFADIRGFTDVFFAALPETDEKRAFARVETFPRVTVVCGLAFGIEIDYGKIWILFCVDGGAVCTA